MSMALFCHCARVCFGRFASIILTVAIWLGAARPVAAQYTWNSSSSGSWDEHLRWTPNGIPGAGSSVVIPQGSPYVEGSHEYGTILIDGGALGLSLGGQLTGGQIDLSSGTLELSVGSTLTAGHLNGGQTGPIYLALYDYPSFITEPAKLTNPSATLVGEIEAQIAGNWTISGTLSVNGTAGASLISVYSSKGVLDAGTLSLNATSIDLYEGGRLKTGAATLGQTATGSVFATLSGDPDGYDGTRWDFSTLTIGQAARTEVLVEVNAQLSGGAFSIGALGKLIVRFSGYTDVGALTVSRSNDSTPAIQVSSGSSLFTKGLSLASSAGTFGRAEIDNGILKVSTADLVVGNAGTGQLSLYGQTAAKSSQATSTGSVIIGKQTGSNGTVEVGTIDSPFVTLTIDDLASVVEPSLTVGLAGKGTLSIAGQVTVAGRLFIAGDNFTASNVASPTRGGSVTVSGSGARLTIGERAAVGANGSGELTISSGGKVTVQSGDLVVNSPSLLVASSVINVGGTNSLLELTGTIGAALRLADTSGRGQLFITTRGRVTSAAGYIGGSVGTSGYASVSGTNASWVIQDPVLIGVGILQIGRYDLTEGALDVASGGSVQVNGQITIATNGGVGTVTVNGGTLSSGSTAGGLPDLLVGIGGSVSVIGSGQIAAAGNSLFDGGSLFVSQGQFQSGTLQIGAAASVSVSGVLASANLFALTGGSVSSIAGKFTLGTFSSGSPTGPAAGTVNFTVPGSLQFAGKLSLVLATTNLGVSGSITNGQSSATLSATTGNSVLVLTGGGALDLTGAIIEFAAMSSATPNFDPNLLYSWQIIQIGPSTTVTGVGTATVQPSGFGPVSPGSFFLVSDANGVYVQYITAAPEPTFVLTVASLALLIVFGIQRRRRWSTRTV